VARRIECHAALSCRRPRSGGLRRIAPVGGDFERTGWLKQRPNPSDFLLVLSAILYRRDVASLAYVILLYYYWLMYVSTTILYRLLAGQRAAFETRPLHSVERGAGDDDAELW